MPSMMPPTPSRTPMPPTTAPRPTLSNSRASSDSTYDDGTSNACASATTLATTTSHAAAQSSAPGLRRLPYWWQALMDLNLITTRGVSCIGVESNDAIAPDGSGMIAEVLKGSAQRGYLTVYEWDFVEKKVHQQQQKQQSTAQHWNCNKCYCRQRHLRCLPQQCWRQQSLLRCLPGWFRWWHHCQL